MTIWIPILVPEQDYLKIAELVSEWQAERGESGHSVPTMVDATLPQRNAVAATDTVATAALVALHVWSVEDLRALANSNAVTAQRWTRAMDVCAKHVGKFLSTQQIAEEAEMTVNEWRDAPRKIARHLANNYPQVGGHWPLAAKSGRQIGQGDDQMYWAISAAQAAQWAEARHAL